MRKTLVNLGFIIAIFFSCAFFEFALMRDADMRARREVNTLSEGFPIVVVTADKAQVVWGDELNGFTQEHSDYSFLVPAEKYASFQEQIKANTRARSNASNKESIPFWDANFTMEAIASNRQKFVVFATWDDDRENVGEYEATEKELFPKYHKFYFGPGKILVTLPLAVLLTAILWGVLGTAVWFWRRRKRIK